MKLTEIIIDYKSTPENYDKEESGLKPTTARIIEPGDERVPILYDMMEANEYGFVRITNTECMRTFTRRITDVTKFGVINIISWNPNEVE